MNHADPSGNIPIDTVVDAISVLIDTVCYCLEPTEENKLILEIDVASLGIPYVPALARAGSTVGKGVKALNKADEVIEVTGAVTKGVLAFSDDAAKVALDAVDDKLLLDGSKELLDIASKPPIISDSPLVAERFWKNFTEEKIQDEIEDALKESVDDSCEDDDNSDDMSGPVIFTAPPNATPAQIQQVKDYVDGCNRALAAGVLSSTGCVSTQGILRQEASEAARKERARAAQAGNPYKGNAGHVPDTTWTGNPNPYSWLDLDPTVNSSLGAQSLKYPVGYKPTIFKYEERK